MFKSLRTRLFLWYVLSLALIGVFFYIFVHILALNYGLEVVLGLFVVLAVIGFVFIYRVTASITNLTIQIKKISIKNLDTRIIARGQDEIGELSQSFNNLLDHLGEAFKREQQFIADVAHEMKTPLATLRSSLEVALSRERTTDEYKDLIKDSISEVNTVSGTLKNVLDLAWLDAPAGHSKPILFNLSQTLVEIVEIAEKLASQKSIVIVSDILPAVTILGYSGKLSQAILNLVDNAIKYTPSKGTVTIRLEVEESRIVIGITDTGPGISKEDQPHIFERFYRSPHAAHIAGTGLGLAICKAVITLHDGEIKVKSRPKEGTTFVVIIPKPLRQSS